MFFSECPTPCSRVFCPECHTPYSQAPYSKYLTPYSWVSYSEYPTLYKCALLRIDTIQIPASHKSCTVVGAFTCGLFSSRNFRIWKRFQVPITPFLNLETFLNSYTTEFPNLATLIFNPSTIYVVLFSVFIKISKNDNVDLFCVYMTNQFWQCQFFSFNLVQIVFEFVNVGKTLVEIPYDYVTSYST